MKIWMFKQVRRFLVVIIGMVLALGEFTHAGDKTIKLTPKEARELDRSLHQWGEDARRERQQREKETDQRIRDGTGKVRDQLWLTHPEVAQALEPNIGAQEDQMLERHRKKTEEREQRYQQRRKEHNKLWHED